MRSYAEERNVSNGPEHTRSIAGKLAEQLESGAVLSLHGELGSGKTCFVQGLAWALGVQQAVSSPTYTIINEYVGRLPVYHIDLFRVQTPEEALALGIENYLEPDGITVVEWGERAADLFPEHTVHVTLDALSDRNSRVITIGRPEGGELQR